MKYFENIFSFDGLIIQISPNWFLHNPVFKNYNFNREISKKNEQNFSEKLSRLFLRSAVGELIVRKFYNIPLPQNYSGERSINEERTVFKDGNKFEKYALLNMNDPNLQHEIDFIYGRNYKKNYLMVTLTISN